MQITPVAEMVGVLIIAAAFMRAAISASLFAGRSIQAARRDKKYVEQFKAVSATALKKAQAQREARKPGWKGKRKFQIAKRVYENQARDICSFYLVPYDGQPLPPFQPGQFLTFELPNMGQRQKVVRCYSLSSSPNEKRYYRVSIRRLSPPPGAPRGTQPGLGSSYFHDRLREGDLVDVLAPAGEFYLDQDSQRPVVFIAGGVGLTPLISMLSALVEAKSRREIWFFYGTRHRGTHAMYDYMKAIRQKTPNVQMVIAYSQPSRTCKPGVDYTLKGHVNGEMLWPVLATKDCDIYMCGPTGMMEAITRDLTQWGISPKDIRREAFGAAGGGTPKKKPNGAVAKAGQTFRVLFARSGKTLQWTSADGTLLDLAEANGIKARCACRQGMCGTCTARLKQGKVGYARQPECAIQAGACLPCVAHPRSDVVLDL